MSRAINRFAVIVTLIASSFLSGCSEPADKIEEESAGPAKAFMVQEKDIAATIKAIRSEPKVRDLYYDPDAAIRWHVAVDSDGSSRKGYAEYLCLILRENDVMDDWTSVRVVDFAMVNSGSDFRSASLGHVRCKDGTSITP